MSGGLCPPIVMRVVVFCLIYMLNALGVCNALDQTAVEPLTTNLLMTMMITVIIEK